MIRTRSSDEIRRDLLRRVQENTGIVSPVGFAKAVIDHVATGVGDVYSVLANMDKWQVSSASGPDLDDLASVWGISRTQASTAEDDTGNNIRFYIDPATGLTAGELVSRLPNSTGTITIPIGTRVSNGTVTYKTVTTGLLSGDSTETFVSIVADGAGPNYNTTANTILTHNISDYATLSPIASYIKVQNRLPITNGAYRESDANLRVRVNNAIRSIATGNRVAIQQAVRNVRDVSDAVVVENIHGVGTTGILVQSRQAITTDALIERVQQTVDRIKPIGESIVVVKPTYRGVEISVGVKVARGVEKNDVLGRVREMGIEYINSQSLGSGRFMVNELISRAMAISGVEDIAIYALRLGYYDPSRGRNRNVKPVAISNFGTDPDEKLYTNHVLFSPCVIINE